MVSVDLGLQVEGLIAKSGFTLTEDAATEKLVEASKDAMNRGIEMAGLDARVEEIAKGMLEVTES